MIKKVLPLFLALILVSQPNSVFACVPVPIVVNEEEMRRYESLSSKEKEALAQEQQKKLAKEIFDYHLKINSPWNIIESPKPSWYDNVSKSQMIRDSGRYVQIFSIVGLCSSRGIYIQKWMLPILFFLIFTFFILMGRKVLRVFFSPVK